MTDHSIFHGWSASYVLGVLEPAERRSFEDHLAACDRCTREVTEFSPLPGLLGRTPSEVAVTPPQEMIDRAVLRARSEWSDLVRSRRRWRAIAAAAALTATVVAVTPQLTRSQPDATWVVDSATASGSVSLEARPWGTAIHLDLRDLPWRQGYVAWVVDSQGNAQQVAVWSPTESGVGILNSTSSVALTEIDTVAVTDLSGEERLLTARE